MINPRIYLRVEKKHACIVYKFIPRRKHNIIIKQTSKCRNDSAANLGLVCLTLNLGYNIYK